MLRPWMPFGCLHRASWLMASVVLAECAPLADLLEAAPKKSPDGGKTSSIDAGMDGDVHHPGAKTDRTESNVSKSPDAGAKIEGGVAAEACGRPMPNDAANTRWVYNIVDPEGTALAKDYLEQAGAIPDGLKKYRAFVQKSFYSKFCDDYDFLYILAQATNGYTGLFSPVDDTATANEFGSSGRLKGFINIEFNRSQGPLKHETLHRWSMHADSDGSLGLSDEGRSHWSDYVSANGNHGGFDFATLTCLQTNAPPIGSPPSCPVVNGRINVIIAYEVKEIPYSPWELYLMGLVPASDLKPLVILNDAKCDLPPTYRPPVTRYPCSASGMREFRIEDLIAKIGPAPAATQRAFRGAVILVTEQPATAEQLAKATQWSQVFGNADGKKALESFEGATGGGATMDTRLGPER